MDKLAPLIRTVQTPVMQCYSHYVAPLMTKEGACRAYSQWATQYRAAHFGKEGSSAPIFHTMIGFFAFGYMMELPHYRHSKAHGGH